MIIFLIICPDPWPFTRILANLYYNRSHSPHFDFILLFDEKSDFLIIHGSGDSANFGFLNGMRLTTDFQRLCQMSPSICKVQYIRINQEWTCITETPLWAQWHLKSPASLLFSQALVQVGANQRKKLKPPHHWPLWWDSIGDRWIPLTKGQLRENVSICWRHHGKSYLWYVSQCCMTYKYFLMLQ